MARISQTMIAQQAGVSSATVSLVLSGDPRGQISDSTKAKVLQIAQELGYMAPLLEHGGRTRTHNIGYLLEGTAAEKLPDNAYYANFRQGLIDSVARYEYDLLVSTCDPVEGIPALVKQRKVDGIIVDAAVSDAWLMQVSRKLPLVLVNGLGVGRASVDYVHTDAAAAVRVAVEHFVGFGHHRIALFGLGGETSPFFPVRVQGYHEALQAAGLPIVPAYEVMPDAQTRSLDEVLSVARQALTQWQALPQPPTAVFALNDQYAMGLSKAAREMGLSIPEDFSLIGYDNTFAGQCQHPALTSIDHRSEAVAHAAMMLLMDRLDAPERPVMTITIAPELVRRETVAPPRK